MSTWWVAALAFLGALLGAAIPAWVALRGQGQDARSEWRQRLDQAIDLATSDADTQQQIGDELLADLIESDLGSEGDRDLARRVALIRVRQQLHANGGEDLVVDRQAPISDNETNEQETTS